MPKLAAFDTAGLDRILQRQHSVIGRDQALGCAMTVKTIRHRIREGGPWQVVLPGVYAAGGGALTDDQRAVAAFVHAGQAIAITGAAAVTWHEIPIRRADFVDVLVPLGCRRSSVGFARLHRTSLPPEVSYEDGAVTYADPARAVADAVRMLADLSEVRALVSAGVQRGKVQIWQLAREIERGQVRGSARLRLALAEVSDGVRSIAEADLRTLIVQSKLPSPLYNPRLFIGSEFLAAPDAWWPEAGVAVEVDSRAWHLSPADWDATLARDARMTAQGILVLHFTPRRLRVARREVVSEIRSALTVSKGTLPHIRTERLR